ncbi:hypothetical protein LEP1GSC083_4306 [Leptospira interrogans serovar Pyrogenes str. L0374]|uniref:Uncharacterized protein n=1 Tax=Leptospira interrogans serovar Pyrogenes str. L0374 TaxID=1049928 RepID=M6K4D3_LEPIR|nr:hypothetical protein LEP1GSC019_1400 [Leptospira interrogans serovar Pyrogenes str. 2006006960]EMN28976.1 hypothetical protein LEP1GSC083_4306 [Leptospira interrogans serovar Pyrogenes str. L0374]
MTEVTLLNSLRFNHVNSEKNLDAPGQEILYRKHHTIIVFSFNLL